MVQHFSHSAVRVWCVCAKRVYISVRVCASVVVMQVIQTLRASVCVCVCPASLHLFIGQKVRLSRRHRVCLCVFASSLYDSVSHFSNSVISPLGTKLIKLKFLSVCVCVYRGRRRGRRGKRRCFVVSSLFSLYLTWNDRFVSCVFACVCLCVCVHTCADSVHHHLSSLIMLCTCSPSHPLPPCPSITNISSLEEGP